MQASTNSALPKIRAERGPAKRYLTAGALGALLLQLLACSSDPSPTQPTVIGNVTQNDSGTGASSSSGGEGQDGGNVTTDAGPDGPAVKPAPVPIAPGVYEVSSSVPDEQTDDLRSMDAFMQNASIIGLGESVHTTGGQIRMRVRLLRHMIETLGVRAIAFESSWQDIISELGPYVERCSGSAESAVKTINPIWWDTSLPQFAEWLCKYNQSHMSDPVRVFGFDIRQPWHDQPTYKRYIEKVNQPASSSLVAGLSTCLGVGFAGEREFFTDPKILSYYASTPTPEPASQACQTGAQAALADLTQKKAEYIAASSEEEWAFAHLALKQLGGFDKTIYLLSRATTTAGLAAANAARDPVMFEAFQLLRKYRFPNQKTALWGHNGHLYRAPELMPGSQWVGVQSLGKLLATEYKDRYVVLAQFSQDTTTTFQGKAEPLAPTRTGSFERLFGNYGKDFLFANVAEVAGAQMALPMGTEQKRAIPLEQFSLVVWHRKSPEMTYFAKPE
jgi:erythromycin esterase-like protein